MAQLQQPGSFTTFGELLKHLRRRAQLTQQALGNAVGYSFSTICKLEANERQPDVATVRARFVEALGLQHEPAFASRLVELARDSHGKTQPPDDGARMPLVGRLAEMQPLGEALSRAIAGCPQCAIIAGEAGIGKTRLAEELVGWANRQGAATATAHCYAAEGALAYAPVRAWLRAEPFAGALLALDPIWLTEVARLVPEVLAARLDLPAPGPLTEGWQRQRFHEGLARALTGIGCPVLLFLDDLQWADRETLEWLRFLLHADTRAQLLLLGTVRSEEVTAGHPLTAFVEAARGAGFVQLELGPLTPAESATLAKQVAGSALTATQADYLFHETEGNPLFVTEMASGADWRNVLPAAPPDQSPVPHFQSLPPTIQSVIARRLNQLSPQAYALVGVAATVGREFRFDVLAAAAEQPDDALVDTLDELLRRRIVREHAAADDAITYDFSHSKIRDAAYAGLSAARRRLLHRQVGEALAAVYARAPDAVCAQIAVHLDQAGMLERALGYFVLAAEASQRVYANSEAIRYYRRALELLMREPLRSASDASERTRAVSESLGDLLYLTGQHAEAQGLYERALRYLPAREDGNLARAQLQRKVANTHVPRHEHPAAEQAFDLADAALGEPSVERLTNQDWCREWLRVQADRTMLYYWINQPEKIDLLVERMRPMLDRYGAPAERARVYRALVHGQMRMSRYVISDELLDYAREYLAAQRELDDPAGLAYALFIRGFVWLWRGDLDQAEAWLRQSLAQAERVGDVTTETRSLNYLAVTCRKRGDVANAQHWVERTLDAAARAGMPEYAVQCRSNQAWFAWKQGRLEQAESIGQAVLDEVERMPMVALVNPLLWEVLLPLIDLARRRGNLARAATLAARVLDPKVQRLPDALATELQSAVDSFGRADLEAVRMHLRASIDLACQTGYL